MNRQELTISARSWGSSIKIIRTSRFISKIENNNFATEAHGCTQFSLDRPLGNVSLLTSPRLKVLPTISTDRLNILKVSIEISMKLVFLISYRFTRAKTILDIALEDDSVGLGESERLVDTLEGGAIWSKSKPVDIVNHPFNNP